MIHNDSKYVNYLELAKRFARLGYDVDVVTRRFEGQPEYDEVNNSLRVWRIPYGGGEFIRKEDMHESIQDFVNNFLSEVRRKGRRYDVVNSHYWDAGWAGQRIAEELQLPHVHTPHSLGWWKKQDMEGARGSQLHAAHANDIDAQIELFKQHWLNFDPRSTGKIEAFDLPLLLTSYVNGETTQMYLM